MFRTRSRRALLPGRGIGASSLRQFGILLALVMLCVFFTATSQHFLTTNNILTVLVQVSVNGIISMGMTVVIITAGIDLSVGALAAIISVFTALMAVQGSALEIVVLTFAIALGLGILGGAINGIIVSRTGVNPLIVTLGTYTAYYGFVQWYRVQPVYNLPEWYTWMGQGSAFGIPIPIVILVLVVLATGFMLNQTRFGRYIYAIGGNEEAARAAGVDVLNVKLGAYVFCGVCVAIAALVYTGRVSAGEPIAGANFNLNAIAATVIGGASLFGGSGRVSNTLIGALIMGVLLNGLVLLNVPFQLQQVATGIIIIGAVWLDGMFRQRELAARAAVVTGGGPGPAPHGPPDLSPDQVGI